MPSGGPRPGSGRPKGLPDKPRREAIARARDGGHLPHEALLAMARNLMALASRYAPVETNASADEDKFVRLCLQAADVYAKCAPYFTPKLTALKVSFQSLDLTKLSDNELAALERIMAVGRRDQGGASTPLH